AELPSLNPACARSFVPGPHGRGSFPFALFYFDVEYTDGPPDLYQVPLAISTGAQLDEIVQNQARAVIATFHSAIGQAILHDASVAADFHQDLLDLIVCNSTLALSPHGVAEPVHAPVPLTGMPSNAQARPWGDSSMPLTPTGGVETPVSPAPLSAQPGEAAAPPRSIETAPAPGADRRQPRESPTAGNPIPSNGRLDARASTTFAEIRPAQRLATRVGSAEQSNTSI